MSLKTWMKEFYGPMSKATGSWKAACAHSLRKWEGASKANLKKHRVELTDTGVVDKAAKSSWTDIDTLYFDGDSCALCKRSNKVVPQGYGCDACPLSAQEGVDCNHSDSAFFHYMNTGSPTKMIRALRKLDKQLSKAK